MNNTGTFYTHSNGKILKLITLRKSNVNTYVHCNEDGKPIIAKRKWLMGKYTDEQRHIVRGFSSLVKIDQLDLFNKT